jgi:hypothetical protein
MMTMGCLALVLATADGFGGTTAPQGAQSPRKLVDAQPSIDSLIEKFRQALETKDKVLLHRLRLTEDEYRNIILPGSVEPGQTGQSYSEEASKYFWGILNGKSTYSEAALLHVHGGKPIKVTDVEYRKGIKKYRDYTAYKQLTVTLDDGSGEPDHTRIGSIAEVDGQFKFISFVRD